MMRHKILATAFIFLFVFSSAPAIARLYKYTDSKGIVHFTDKLATVPAKYKAQIVKENESPASETQKPAEATSEFSAPQLSSESAQGKNVVEEPIESSKFSVPEKPAKTKPIPTPVAKTERPSATTSEFSAPQQPAKSAKAKEVVEEPMVTSLSAPKEKPSEFTAAPAPVAKKEEPAAPAAAEFSYKAPESTAQKPEVAAVKEPEAPVSEFSAPQQTSESTKAKEPAEPSIVTSKSTVAEKPSEFKPTPAPAPVPVPVQAAEPEKPASSEFSYKAPETAVEKPDVVPEKAPAAVPVVAIQTDSTKKYEEPPAIKAETVVEKETPAKTSQTVETGFIGGSDEGIKQAEASQTAETIKTAPVVVEKEPEKAQAEPEIEKTSPKPEPAPAAITDEPPQKSAKEIELAKMIEKRNILAEKKEALNKKFDDLMKERKRLDAGKDNLKDQASIDQYNQDVKDLNAKIKKYKEDEKALKEEIEEYNKSIKQSSIQ